MTDTVLATGWAPLTEYAADCALDLILGMTATVFGHQINITQAMRAAWRAHLAAHYAMLAQPDQIWFANAPMTLAAIQQGWAQLPPMERDMVINAWANVLPALLHFASPVVHAAIPPAAPAAAPTPSPRAAAGSQVAIDELARIRAQKWDISRIGTLNVASTLDLMSTWSRR